MCNGTMTSPYRTSAYHSGRFPKQKPRAQRGLLKTLLSTGQLFEFTQTDRSVPAQLYQTKTPSQWAQERKQHHDIRCYWNEESLIMESVSPWGLAYIFMVSIAKGIATIMTPFIMVLFLIIAPLFVDWVTFGKGVEVVWWYIKFILPPSCLIWGHAVLHDHGYRESKTINKIFSVYKQSELNRQTGMVTFYNRRGKVRFSHPFIEFDCILGSNASHQGILNYSLLLVHRYQKYKHGVPIGNLIGDSRLPEEYRRLWNVIQQYMDISQPLPDFLLLEEARPNDPTTAEYDKQTGRDPHYWRAMSDAAYTKCIEEIILHQKFGGGPSGGMPIDIFEPSAECD